jgi:hypothetical protein
LAGATPLREMKETGGFAYVTLGECRSQPAVPSLPNLRPRARPTPAEMREIVNFVNFTSKKRRGR